MKTLISINNKKLTKDNIFSFNIPAAVTCPFAGDCRKICYAQKGNFKYRNVQKSHSEHFLASQKNDFCKDITAEIIFLKIKVLRIHASGDFYSFSYLKKWLKIAKNNPKTIFYAYTKSVSFLKLAEKRNLIPKNFKYLFSLGGLQDKLVNKELDRYAEIVTTSPKILKKDEIYIPAGGSDTPAFDRNIRVIYLQKH